MASGPPIKIPRTQEQRFWDKVNVFVDGDACWEWQTGKTQSGYGVFWSAGYVRAHRFCWQIINGPIPPDMLVLHSCDNPPCVRPSHLRLGTNAENMRDCTSRGRRPTGNQHPFRRVPEAWHRGENHYASRLTDDAVREIRALYAGGTWTHRALGARFGVARPTIKHIVRGRTWRHI